MWVWLERKSWKRADEMEIPDLIAEFVCMCVWEKKNSSFKIYVIILMYIRNVNLPFKKDFKFAELLTKTYFSVYVRERPENGKGNKWDVESICTKVTKHASKILVKPEANLNWLWTIEFIMDYFCCIFISTKDSTDLAI